MVRLTLSWIILSVCLIASPVHLFVPPKTPVLSGFEPAAIGTGNRDLVCDASQPDSGTITYKWYKYVPPDSHGYTWESKGPIGTGQKYIFNLVFEKQVFHQGGEAEHVTGKYLCRASNAAGTRDSEWGDLYVYTPCSHYTVSARPVKPADGSTFTVNCYIPNPSGFTVEWRKQADSSSSLMNVAVANSKGCHTSGNARYSWSSCSPTSITSSKTKTFNLKVTNAQTSDSAYWTCKDINLSCNSDPVKLVIQAQPGTPQITGFPTGPVAAGGQVNLKCVASPLGDMYNWYKDDAKVSTSVTYDFQVKKESAGVYKCVTKNAAGSATSSDKMLIVYSKAESVIVSSGKTSCHAGDSDRFTCTATGGSPPPTLKIYIKRLGGAPVMPVEVTKGQDRTMVKEDNQAEYYCEAKAASYPSFDMTSPRMTYNVTFPNTRVSFIKNPTAAVQVGQVKKLTCETDGSNPVTSITWYQDVGGSLQGVTTGITSTVRNGVYGGKIRISEWSFTATKTMNSRSVRCTAGYSLTGHDFTTKADAVMSVKWSATELKMVKKPNSPILAGTNVNIKCETDSSNSGSPGTISWYRNGQRITSGVTPSTRSATDGGAIYISQLAVTARKEDNQAKYECKINNQANLKRDVTITVHFPPSGIKLSETSIRVREGESKTTTCSTTSSSNPAVSGVSLRKRLGSTVVDVTGPFRVTDGAYYGKDVSIDITLDTNRKDNGAQYICSFTYGSTSFTKTATVNVLWSTTDLKMVEKPNSPITAGTIFNIKCETDSSNYGSPGTISWYRNGHQITTGVTPSTRSATDGGAIYISQLTFKAKKEDNQAKFECKINNQANLKKDVTIKVHFPPSGIKLSETSIRVREGESKTTTCSTTSSSNPAVSGVSLRKRLGSTVVDVTGPFRVTDGAYYGKDVSIDITLDTNRKDNGAQYICSFTYGSTSFTKTATVNVQFNPSKITMIQNPTKAIHEGQPIMIVCETDSANPAADIQFFRKRTGRNWVKQLMSGIISEDRNAPQYKGLIRKSTLTVTANRLDHQTAIECKVKDGTFQVEQTTTVTVYYPPAITLSLSPSKVKEGDTPSVTCVASGGNPSTYTYHWLYKQKLVKGVTSKVYGIKNIQANQSGSYCCQAVNYSPVGKAVGCTRINVLFKAKWNQEMPMMFAVASKPYRPIKFTLHVIANPSITGVTWVDPNTKPAKDENFIPTKVNETTFALSKSAIGFQDYGDYTARVSNSVGTSSFVFELKQAGPPPTPCCLKRVNASSVYVTLAFKSNFNGGSVQTFTIEYRKPGAAWRVGVKDKADPGFGHDVIQRMSGLKRSTIYEFRVKAVNKAGSSSYGNIMVVETLATQNITLTVVRHGNIVTATWSPIELPYTRIQVKYCPMDALTTCYYHTLTDPQEYHARFNVKEGTNYMFYLEVFEGADEIFKSSPLTKSPRKDGWEKTAFIVTAIILLGGIVTVAVSIVMYRRSMACFSNKDKSKLQSGGRVDVNDVNGSSSLEPVYVNVNRAFDDAPDQDIPPVYVNDGVRQQQVEGAIYDDIRSSQYQENAQENSRNLEGDTREMTENLYADLNITPDVIASQGTYEELKPYKNN